MSLDIEKSLKYVFEDKQWKKKVLIGSAFSIFIVILQILKVVLNFVGENTIKNYIETLAMTEILKYSGILGIVLLVILIISSILTGYYFKNVNLRLLKPDNGLYEWKGFGDLLVVGLKSLCAILVYSVIILFVFGICIVLGIFISILVFEHSVVGGIISFIIFLLISLILYLIFCCIYLPACSLAFSTNLKFSSYFNLPLISKFITKKFWSYMIYLLLLLAINCLFSMAYLILFISIIGIVLLPAVKFYSGLVVNEISAQFIRDTLELNVNKS